MEHELSTLLRDRAERIRVDRTRRESTLKRARRGRGLVVATVLFGVASVVVIGVSVAGSLREETPRPVPVDRPTEHRDPGEEDVAADILIAEAPDGSWSMFAGVSEDGEILCLSLEGTGCVATTGRDSFTLLQSFGHPEQEGFIYGPVKSDVAALELVIGEKVIPLRLREFPDRLALNDLRFFVRAVAGDGNGVIVARDKAGRVLQEMEVAWGQE